MYWIRTAGYPILLILIAFFGVQAIHYHDLEAQVAAGLTDPHDDPEYRDMAQLTPLEISMKYGDAKAEEFLFRDQAYRNQLYRVEQDKQRFRESRNINLVLIGFTLFGVVLLALPWGTWVLKGGNRAVRASAVVIEAARDQLNVNGAKIIGKERLTSYSVADELLKWKKLLDDQAISEAEYQDAKAKLLGTGPRSDAKP